MIRRRGRRRRTTTTTTITTTTTRKYRLCGDGDKMVYNISKKGVQDKAQLL